MEFLHNYVKIKFSFEILQLSTQHILIGHDTKNKEGRIVF